MSDDDAYAEIIRSMSALADRAAALGDARTEGLARAFARAAEESLDTPHDDFILLLTAMAAQAVGSGWRARQDLQPARIATLAATFVRSIGEVIGWTIRAHAVALDDPARAPLQ